MSDEQTPDLAPPDHDPWEHVPQRTHRPWWFWLATGFGGLVLFLSACFVALYYIYAPSLSLTADRLGELNRTPSITLSDADGKVFATRGAAFGYRVKVEEMPKYLPLAFIVTEDRRFYTHGGVDYRGLIRAFFRNWTAGGVVQGGSTITQQLAKNTFLTPQRTWRRKLEEMFLSFWLERHYTKDEIMTLYLNRIYLGSGAYGVDAAAREYFGKSIKDVTLPEAAMLAALTRAPSRYSPDANLKLAQERASLVVTLLYQQGYISEGDATKAKAHPAKPVIKPEIESANYFADYVMDQLKALDITPNKDLIVRTTIDIKLQGVAQKTITRLVDKEGAKRNVSQGAMIAMEPSGAIRSLVGGKDYSQSSYNRVYQSKRQPGSSFKPFVYLAALEAGLTPDDVREDAPYENRGWSPENYDGQYLGSITLREALAKSINTVAVRIADEVGRRKIISVAQRLGISSPLEPNRSLPLGTSEVTLFEMTRAFAAFANHGNRVEPYAILEVKTSDGTVLYQYREKPAIAVMNQTELEEMNQMMYEVVQTGTGQRADLSPRQVGAKTGTSQEWRDAWFVGYTADFVGGVWVGNDDNTSMAKIVGGSIPASVWKAYMIEAHRKIAMHPLPGVYNYDGSDGSYPPDAGSEDNPWVERDGDTPGSPDENDKGVVEDFFDRLFGGGHDERRAPPPPPPPPPPPAPDESAPGEPHAQADDPVDAVLADVAGADDPDAEALPDAPDAAVLTQVKPPSLPNKQPQVGAAPNSQF
jgi:penicillin-binding protein 1A